LPFELGGQPHSEHGAAAHRLFNDTFSTSPNRATVGHYKPDFHQVAGPLGESFLFNLGLLST
jgi:hypothetical protein